MNKKMVLFFYTIKYLKPSQIYFRILNRLKRELYKRKVLTIKIPKGVINKIQQDFLIPELDYNEEYLSRCNIEDLMQDKFTFINITNQENLSQAWNNKELQHLWRYNLHYFEYLFQLAYRYKNETDNERYFDKYRYLICNWIDNNPMPLGDGWHPYTISLRVTNWICTYEVFKERIVKDKQFESKLIDSLYEQYKYLQHNLEKDVLGNHYFENIKALIVGSLFFKESRVKDKFIKELLIQLRKQILKDGMHFELSPMYHKIMLEDLIKITYWLQEEKEYIQLVEYVQNMLDVAYSFEKNTNKTPAFNDSADRISKTCVALISSCKTCFGIQPALKEELEESGFYIINDTIKKVIYDVGEVCPSYLPAHGHCDALSYELSIGGQAVIVNSGTYKYESGEWRDYFRSTKSHNTVVIDNKEQSQYWGSFRIAKRISQVKRAQFMHSGVQVYAGAYRTYQGDKHKRYIVDIDTDMLAVLNEVKVKSKDLQSTVKDYIHFIPGVKVEVKENQLDITFNEKKFSITPVGIDKVEVKDGWYSSQFNKKEANIVLELTKHIEAENFGYLIDFNNIPRKFKQSKKELKIIGNREIEIKYDEMGEKL